MKDHSLVSWTLCEKSSTLLGVICLDSALAATVIGGPGTSSTHSAGRGFAMGNALVLNVKSAKIVFSSQSSSSASSLDSGVVLCLPSSAPSS